MYGSTLIIKGVKTDTQKSEDPRFQRIIISVNATDNSSIKSESQDQNYLELEKRTDFSL